MFSTCDANKQLVNDEYTDNKEMKIRVNNICWCWRVCYVYVVHLMLT